MNYGKTTAAEAAEVERISLSYIVDSYAHNAGYEPKINAAEVADYLMQRGDCPQSISGVKRWVYRAVYAALQRLKRDGRIEASYTLVSGRETRCYNPKCLA